MKSKLTNREKQIVFLASNGQKQAEIATSLRISRETVKFHMNSVRSKLNAKNAVHAVALAVGGGLLVD